MQNLRVNPILGTMGDFSGTTHVWEKSESGANMMHIMRIITMFLGQRIVPTLFMRFPNRICSFPTPRFYWGRIFRQRS